MARLKNIWRRQAVNCGYVYAPERGDRKSRIPNDTCFEDLPKDWRCSVRGAGRKNFKPLTEPGSATGYETPLAEGRP